MDEYTSNIDYKRKILINNLLNNCFTILCIAHDINTIINYNTIMLIDNGYILK